MPSAPNLCEMSGLPSPGFLPSTSIVVDGVNSERVTSSTLKSMRCVSGADEGVCVHGVSTKIRAVATLCAAGMVNVPWIRPHCPRGVVTVPRLVYVPPP